MKFRIKETKFIAGDFVPTCFCLFFCACFCLCLREHQDTRAYTPINSDIYIYTPNHMPLRLYAYVYVFACRFTCPFVNAPENVYVRAQT